MWLFEEPPTDRIRRSLSVELNDDWLQHVQRAALRFDTGGSGAFVGPSGLAITNHHVVRGGIVRLSTPQLDYQQRGFLALAPEEELRIPGLAVRSLVSVEDVTARVNAGIDPTASTPAEAEQLRRSARAAIEADESAETGLLCEVVTLYEGGRYHLYRYNRWTDVRLVWAPEGSIAHFGGDVDNFRYPRFSLDAAIVRVYDDDGTPVRPEHYLRFTEDGIEEGSPTFVAGHPGSTRRTLASDHLRFLRDTVYPRELAYALRRESELKRFAAEDPQHAGLAGRDLPGIRNWRKALDDRLRALQTPAVWQRKLESEASFRFLMSADETFHTRSIEAYADINTALRAHEEIHKHLFILERQAFNRSELFGIARRIVRRSIEKEKPAGERLPAYTPTRIAEIERRIRTEVPIARPLEVHRIDSWLRLLGDELGGDAALLRTLTGEASHATAARRLVEGTALESLEERERLMTLSPEALRVEQDSMIRAAFAIEDAVRPFIERREREVEAPQARAYAMLSAARFTIYETGDYPNATFTLRLSYGRVLGYEDEGQRVPAFADFAGLKQRHHERGPSEPFVLPARWEEALGRIDTRTPLNFVSDHHIIGGNSGSPVVDARARFVGVIFDGNRGSASWGSVYEGERGRAISVDARAIALALRDVYDAGWLLDELTAAE